MATKTTKTYIDFEYRNNHERNDLVLFTWHSADNEGWIDLRDGAGQIEIETWFTQHKNDTLLTFNADAEINCLYTLGVNVTNLSIVDVQIEWNIIRLTHKSFPDHKGSLISAINCLGIEHTHSKDDKEDTRELILTKRDYTETEWKKIVEYGMSDVRVLPEVMRRIAAIHNALNTKFKNTEAVQRGKYVLAASVKNRETKGFPVNERIVREIYSNRIEVKRTLIKRANSQYGNLWSWNKLNKDYSFRESEFEKLVEGLGLAPMWQRTKSNKLSKKKDYIGEMCKAIPSLELLHTTRNTINALNSTDLSELLVDGYIKPASGYRSMAQVTGRTSPKPKEGFVLNLPPWLRHIIQPQDDQVFIGIDWSQQEIAIAAVLSGDDKLKEAYCSGDIYSYLAKMAGAITSDQFNILKTKQSSHPDHFPAKQIRDQFKSVQLGIGYGRTEAGLQDALYAMFLDKYDSLEQARSIADERASEIYHWHLNTFDVYWEWVRENVETAYDSGFIRSLDGWTYFTHIDTKTTQLKNFPMQSNGAAMMREAVRRTMNTDIDLVCSLHDALYINSNLERMNNDVEKIGQLMDQASVWLLGDEVLTNRETSIYTSAKPYSDERGKELWEYIVSMIDKSLLIF